MRSEESTQIGIVEYLRELGLLFSATCGGINASISQKAKMKRTGYSRGIPDLMIFEPRGEYFGLFLEVKSQHGIISEEQIKWIAALNERGYKACVVYSVSDAKRCINEYINSNQENKDEDIWET